jgi:uncharacterized protein YciI
MVKRILLLCALVAVVGAAAFVTGRSLASGQKKETQFAGVFKAARADFVKNGPRAEDMPYLQQHVKYWLPLTDQGVCLAVGHTLNHDETAFGIAVVKADTEAVARKIMEDDPIVRAGILTVTVYPFEGVVTKKP